MGVNVSQRKKMQSFEITGLQCPGTWPEAISTRSIFTAETYSNMKNTHYKRLTTFGIANYVLLDFPSFFYYFSILLVTLSLIWPQKCSSSAITLIFSPHTVHSCMRWVSELTSICPLMETVLVTRYTKGNTVVANVSQPWKGCPKDRTRSFTCFVSTSWTGKNKLIYSYFFLQSLSSHACTLSELCLHEGEDKEETVEWSFSCDKRGTKGSCTLFIDEIRASWIQRRNRYFALGEFAKHEFILLQIFFAACNEMPDAVVVNKSFIIMND